MSEYADFLKYKIKRSGLTLSQIVNELKKKGVKVTVAYLSKVQNGKNPPASEQLNRALAEIIECDPAELIRLAYLEKIPPEIRPYIEKAEDIDDVFYQSFEFFIEHIKKTDRYNIARAIETGEMLRLKEAMIKHGVDSAFINSLKEVDLINFLTNIPPESYSSVYKNLDFETKLLLLDHLVKEAKNRNYKAEQLVYEELKKYKAEFTPVPVVGEIKAGYNMIGEQNILGYELTPKKQVSNGKYFYLVVKGDSMIGEGIKEGDRVLVKQQNYVENGKIAVVLIDDEEVTLKRVFYQDDGKTVLLQASNPSIPPKILPIEDVKIQGQVIKVEFDV